MSHAMRKTVFGGCAKARLKPACSATQTSYGLEILDLAGKGITILAVNNKGADQTAQMRKLICTFVVYI